MDRVHYVLIRRKGYHSKGASCILNMQEFARKLPGVYTYPARCHCGHVYAPYVLAAGIKLSEIWPVAVGIAEIA